MSKHKTPQDAETVVNQLVHLSQLMARGAETGDEMNRFYNLLDAVLDLPPTQESAVTSKAMGMLVQLGDTEAAIYLAEELDQEFQLQYVKDPQGRRKACVLFAFPVVTCSGDMVQQHAPDEELFSNLHEIVEEADVVDTTAEFGLVPRLFGYTELQALSYGQLRELTRHFATQVMDGAQMLHLPMNFQTAPLDGSSCSPYVDLYFVIGAVVTRESELDQVFPEFEEERDEPQEQAPGYPDDEVQPLSIGSNGETSGGEPWEKPFCEAFNDAFGVIMGSLTTIAPDGLAEDMRRGIALAREVGLLRMFEVHGRELPSEPGAADAPDIGPGYARLSPVQDVDGERFIEVSCIWGPDEPAVETVRWPVLLHETDEDSIQSLLECLEEASISQEFPTGSLPAGAGSYVLH